MKQIDIDALELASRFAHADRIKNKCFLITGATGLVGSVMIRCLLALNRTRGTNVKIIGLIRNWEKATSLFPDSGITWVSDYEEISDSVDFLVHAAAPTAGTLFVTTPVEVMRYMSESTERMLMYCREKNVESCVYLSSLEVYGVVGQDATDVDEAFRGVIDYTSVRSSYPVGKIYSECLCAAFAAEYGVPVKCARLTQTFGAGISQDDSRVFAQFAREVIKGNDIVMHTEGLPSRPYLYVTDAVEAILILLLEGEKGEAYNVANDDTYISISSMADFLISNFGCNLKKIISVPKGQMSYAPTTYLRLNSEKLRRLGWAPRYSLYEMFDRLINHLRGM